MISWSLEYTDGNWDAEYSYNGNSLLVKSDNGEVVAKKIKSKKDAILLANSKSLLNSLEEMVNEFETYVGYDHGSEKTVNNAKKLIDLLK